MPLNFLSEIKNAILQKDLPKIEAVMKLDVWSKLDQYPFYFTEEQWENPQTIPHFSSEDLSTIAFELFNIILASPDGSKVEGLYEFYFEKLPVFSDFDYRLYHLRRYWAGVASRCLIYLAYHKTKNWNIYHFLDNPLHTVNYLIKPPYSEGMSTSWMHQALDAGVFKEKEFFDACFNHYDSRLLSAIYDEYTRSRYFPLNSVERFLEFAVQSFPEERKFQETLFRVKAIQDLEDSELKLYLSNSEDLRSADEYRGKLYKIFTPEILEGKPATHIEMLYWHEKIRDQKDQLDWAINPIDPNLTFLRGASRKKTKWVTTFSYAGAFDGFSAINPNSFFSKYYYEKSTEKTDKKTEVELKDLRILAAEAAGKIGTQFSIVHKDYPQYLKKKSEGCYQLNPDVGFILIVELSTLTKQLKLNFQTTK